MKQSKYNYIIKDKKTDEQHYWFNGLSMKYFKLSKTTSNVLRNLINENPLEVKKQSPGFYKKLVNTGFLIRNNANELNTIRKKHKGEFERKDYSVTILPTLDCNYNCWYCVQEHLEKSKMSLNTIEKVKKHIKYMVEYGKIKTLSIEWFGGEPFMYYDDVIKPINRYAIEICKDHNIPFFSSSTTNGYYLTSDIHNSIIESRIFSYQITLDGIRDKHNKVKFMPNSDESAFDRTLNNINALLTKSPKIILKLRLNYTGDNLDETIVDQVNSIIEKKNRNRIYVLLRKVWQEKPSKKRINIVYKLLESFEKNGYKTSQDDLVSNFITCYAERKYYNTIRPDGTIIKCTANDDLYRKDPLGVISTSGNIKWKKGFLKNYYKIRYENEVCLNCKHLPLCMGNCPIDWENESERKFYVFTYCKMANSDGSFDERILQFIREDEKKIKFEEKIIT